MIHKTTTIDGNNISDILNDTEGVDWISWLIDHDKLKDYRHEIELWYKVVDGVVEFQFDDRPMQLDMVDAAHELLIIASIHRPINLRDMNNIDRVLSAIRKHVYDIGEDPDTRQEIYGIWREDAICEDI